MFPFLQPPSNYSIDDSEAESEIRMIFFQHWSKMKDEMIESVNKINNWRQVIIGQLNKYADEQIRILADDYDRQRAIFDRKQGESLQTARIFSNAQNMQQFKELRDACRELKIQVAKVQSSTGTLSSLKVVTVQKQLDDLQNSNKQIEEKSTVPPSPQTQDAVQENDSLDFNSNSESVIEKCPLCYMIFPLKMIEQERIQHVNEHYTD